MMDNKEKLHQLKDITPPPPSKEAMQCAIDEAWQEFKISKENQITKKQETSKGFSTVVSLIYNFNKNLWNFIMKKQLILGTALASVLAITITTVMWEKGDVIPQKTLPPEKQQPTRAIKLKTKPVSVEKKDLSSFPKSEAKAKKRPQQRNKGLRIPPKRKTFSESFGDKSVSSDSYRGSLGDYYWPMHRQPSDIISHIQPDRGRDQFQKIESNPIKRVSEHPVSTFSIDVDTTSYSFVRKSLNNGVLPQKHAVRIEELINYFDYNYPLPESPKQPFKPRISIYPTPWNRHTKLLHIGLKGRDVVPSKKPKSNLVFLIDVSGSMNQTDKLPLLKNALRLLVNNLQPEDTVGIVTYAGRAATVLEPTKEKGKILAALERLQSGGSTAGERGIKQAYSLVQQNFDKDGVNRVILATDGDFNVGITNTEELRGFIERKRKSSIFLSVLGFGQGNYNDALMQELAQNGNGNAAYIDTLSEAQKVLVDEASSMLFPIAKDVKIQIEFNPNVISEYRLIGYETRMLKRADFKNDSIDAGDIGSGHTVTAIYEITPIGSQAQMIDELRYNKKEKKNPNNTKEYAFLKLRYKLPKENISKLIEVPITKELEKSSIGNTSKDIRFAASVAAFGQLLRGGQYTGNFSYDDVIALAKDSLGDNEFAYRSEFLNLVRLAKSAKNM